MSQASERLAQLPDAQARAINCILPDHASTNCTSAIPNVGAVVALRRQVLVARKKSHALVVEGTSTTVARPKKCETNQSPRPTPTSERSTTAQTNAKQTRAHDRPPQARVIGGSRGGRGGWQAINDRLADGPGFLRFLDEAPQPVKSSSATTEHHVSSVTASWRQRVRCSLNALYRSCPMETDVGATNVKGGPTV